MDLGAAKLLGILLESLGYGELSVSVHILCVRSHRPLPSWHSTAGIFFTMSVCNTYLRIRDLSDKNAMRPNLLLLISSTLLFMMITAVSCFFSGGAASTAGFSRLRDPALGH